VFASNIRLAMSGDNFKKLVSSAKRLVKKNVSRGKSFMYKEETARAPKHFLEEHHML